MRTPLHRFALLLLVLAGLSISSCEEILDAEGLPYEEKLVIHGILFADSTTNTVQITRTLPLNIPFDSNEAYLANAVASISGGGFSYPLVYIGYGGKYRPVGLIPQRGMSYTLSVVWGKKHATATTIIPEAGTIDSAWTQEFKDPDYGWTYQNLYANVKVPEGYSVRFGYWRYGYDPLGGDWETSNLNYGVYSDRSADEFGTVLMRSTIAVPNGNDHEYTLLARAYFFAPGYYEYFESRNADVDVNLGNPALVKWNVQGDAIGIFFGCTVVERKVR